MRTNINPPFLVIASALLLSGSMTITVLAAAPTPDDTGARQTARPGAPAFSIHDIDQDGYLSRAEYRHLIEQIENRRRATGRPMRRYLPFLRFEEVDRDDDGFITEDEMIASLKKRLQMHRRYRYRGGQR
jgi:EF-hand domain pair